MQRGAHLQALLNENEVQPENEEAPHESDEATHYVAIIQNRANEVGLAALELRGRSKLYLAQYVESTRSFTNTLTMLQRFPPKRLLLVASKDGIAESAVNTVLRPYTSVTAPLPRNYFDDTEGSVLVEMLTSTDTSTSSVLEAGKGTYLALGAAGALIKFIQQDQAMALAPNSLQICLISSQHHMTIDASTVEALELVQPLSVGSSGRKGITLFKLLDGTRTKAGAQLLRANLLQPLRDIPTLQLRYEALEELKENVELVIGIDGCLVQLPKNLDTLCCALVLRPAQSEANTLHRIAAMIKSFILLRDALRVLPEMTEALENGQCELFTVLKATCSAPAFGELLTELDELLEEDVHASNNAFMNRTQCCFALKSGVDSLLDVARATFSRLTEQVHELANELRSVHNIPHMKVQYTTKRGFCFSIGAPPKKRKNRNNDRNPTTEEPEEEPQPEDDEYGNPLGYTTNTNNNNNPNNNTNNRVNRGDASMAAAAAAQRDRGVSSSSIHPKIPPGFSILGNTTGKVVVQCTTQELNALNARIRDAGNDCLVLTEKVLERLSTQVIARHLPTLNTLIDGVALLDMLCGLVRSLEVTGREYVRPSLTESGPFVIVEGRHPVLEIVDTNTFQPNDTYLALNASLHIITGANMSGKSTYLRQIALTAIMAQIGCFVPAEFMSFSPIDHLFSRIGTSDSLENNSSSFMVEMQELAYILKNATPRSLVLIDELGRSTSTADGIAIAWSACEDLLNNGARTLFATHFHQLTDVANVYPNVRAWNMQVDVSQNRLDFQWKIKPGLSDVGHYGLLLAKSVGFPESIVSRAETVVEAVEAAEERRMRAYATEEHREMEDVWTVVGNLACLGEVYRESGDVEGMKKGMKELQESLEEMGL